MSKSKAKPTAKSMPKAKKAAAPKSAVTTRAVEPTVTTVDAPAAEAPETKAKGTTEQNGIKRPAADTLCGRVWQVLDDLRTAGADATAKNATAAFDGVAIAAATIRTQYARWRKFNSVVQPQRGSRDTEQMADAGVATV